MNDTLTTVWILVTKTKKILYLLSSISISTFIECFQDSFESSTNLYDVDETVSKNILFFSNIIFFLPFKYIHWCHVRVQYSIAQASTVRSDENSDVHEGQI